MADTVETRATQFNSITFMDFARELGYALGEAFRHVWQADSDNFHASEGVRQSIKFIRDALVTRYKEVSDELGRRLVRKLTDIANHFTINKFCALQSILIAATGNYDYLDQWVQESGLRHEDKVKPMQRNQPAAAI